MRGILLPRTLSRFQRAPTLGGECYCAVRGRREFPVDVSFQRAPTLGGECYTPASVFSRTDASSFNGHPPLGVNATTVVYHRPQYLAPGSFNGHPPLGVNATGASGAAVWLPCRCFNGHPPLGVNATYVRSSGLTVDIPEFQRAPTLGGECYVVMPRLLWRFGLWRFNGHPPLGVNATRWG